jgi:hypothetical protein
MCVRLVRGRGEVCVGPRQGAERPPRRAAPRHRASARRTRGRWLVGLALRAVSVLRLGLKWMKVEELTHMLCLFFFRRRPARRNLSGSCT